MNNTLILCATALGLCLFGAGCETGGVSSRIQEKAGVFGTLSVEQQETIKAGGVELGFSPDMVYMALGKPSNTSALDTVQGKVVKWTYNKYFGPRPTGPSPILNAPGTRYNSVVYGLNSPGVATDPKSNPSSTATKGGVQASLDVPDLQPTTLMVYFLEDIVFDLKIKDS